MIRREHQPAVAIAVLLGLLATVVWYLLAQPARGAELASVPTADQLTLAEADVQDVFGAELAKARKPADKLAVARKMIDTAGGSRPAAKYALLVRARELAIAAGDSGVGIRAVEGLVAGFAPQAQQDAASWASEGHRLWNLAEDKRSADALRMRLEAAECYLRALPELKGFHQTAVGKRLGELGWSDGALAIEDVPKLFGIENRGARVENGELVVTLGNLLGPRGWAIQDLGVACSVDFSFSLKGAEQVIRIDIDGTSRVYLRIDETGNWRFWRGVAYPLPRIAAGKATAESPGEWHRLAVLLVKDKLEFRCDGKPVRSVSIAPTGDRQHRVRVGFGTHRNQVSFKDFRLRSR